MAVIEVPLALVMCVGAFRMNAYRSHRLAWATAILALIPIGPTYVFGVPLGIWALVVPCREDVAEAFASRQAGQMSTSAPDDPAQSAGAKTLPPTSA